MRRKFDPARRPDLEAQLFRLSRAGLTLDQICAIDGWPSRPTLRKWLREKPSLGMLVAHGREELRRYEPRYPFAPEAAAELIRRIRLREPIGVLIREPGLPHRRALTAWKRERPDFAAELAAATAYAAYFRRRYRPRRATMAYTERLSDRIILAVVRGATLPQLYADRTLPSRAGLRRWRKAYPEFDGALRMAILTGHRARGKARVDAHCTPELTHAIEEHIVAGHSLHSLSKRRDMPGLYALYRWVRERPDFARAIAAASQFRDTLLADRVFTLTMGGAKVPAAALRKRLGQLNPNPGERPRKAGR